jgi:hypothetical protein
VMKRVRSDVKKFFITLNRVGFVLLSCLVLFFFAILLKSDFNANLRKISPSYTFLQTKKIPTFITKAGIKKSNEFL